MRGDQGRHHVEVGGSCLELNQLLKQKLDAVHVERAGKAGTAGAVAGDAENTASTESAVMRTAGTAAQCLPYIRAMRNFCQQLCSSV